LLTAIDIIVEYQKPVQCLFGNKTMSMLLSINPRLESWEVGF